ncbi:MAG: T9SS type A sorting domain-containing protein [Bacteroidota bacterium]|nr:T9SS type A sorting domain-containing protein [Bacteroidota bacterium]
MKNLFILLVFLIFNVIFTNNSSGQSASIDYSFNSFNGFNDLVYSTSVLSNQSIIVGGGFTEYNGNGRNRIARLLSNGNNDNSFNIGTGFDNLVTAVAIQTNGQIIVGGSFTFFNGVARNRIARLNTDGTLDLSFDPGSGFNSYIETIAIQSNGKILVGGGFTSYNGTAKNSIARLNNDGTLDTFFGTTSGFSAFIQIISIQSDGKIIIGGDFHTSSGAPSNYIARLNSNGSFDSSFNTGTGFDLSVSSITIQSDGKIIAGGSFSSFNGTSRNRIARINSNGSLDTFFNPGTGFNSSVWTTTVLASGKIIAGGTFTTFNGSARSKIVRLNANGSIDTSFNPGTGFDDNVFSVALNGSNKVIVGGSFTNYNGFSRNRIISLKNCENTTSTINVHSACLSHTENNQTYTSSGIYTQVTFNAQGCDSIITINLDLLDNINVMENNSTLTVDIAGVNYQWVDCDYNFEPIAFQTFQSFTPEVDGYYAVELTLNGCSKTSDCIFVISNDLKENTAFNNQLNIYPNPNNGKFVIETNANTQIQIFNPIGQIILNKILINGINQIELENAENGLYFISLVDEKGIRSTKSMNIIK